MALLYTIIYKVTLFFNIIMTISGTTKYQTSSYVKMHVNQLLSSSSPIFPTQKDWTCSKICGRFGLDCRGFNYWPNTKTCQLLNWSDPEVLVEESGTEVYMKQITCEDNPCYNEGTCVNKPAQAYKFKCICPIGWCGIRCNQLHYGYVHSTCISGLDLKRVDGQPIEECFRGCLSYPGCKSVDYFKLYLHCYYNDRNISDPGATRCGTDPNIEFLFPKYCDQN
ncbi:uncharacterized protein LOC143224310 [Tachypleus tridentatus]|uniref:uncharacterized protein LOC143224310 n=1 Tax=Tachypleus tridentatus TaxID=6853 RepID=UPI003FCFBF08